MNGRLSDPVRVAGVQLNAGSLRICLRCSRLGPRSPQEITNPSLGVALAQWSVEPLDDPRPKLGSA